MMILVPTIVIFLLVSLTLFLYLAGAFHTSPLISAFRLTVYMLLLFLAMIFGIGITVNRSDNPLAIE